MIIVEVLVVVVVVVIVVVVVVVVVAVVVMVVSSSSIVVLQTLDVRISSRGGGTDSDQSRSSGAVDIQTLNGMQESEVQQHFAMHQSQRQRPEVIRIDTDSDSAPRAQPAPRVRAAAPSSGGSRRGRSGWPCRPTRCASAAPE